MDPDMALGSSLGSEWREWPLRWEWFQQLCGSQTPHRPHVTAPTLGLYVTISGSVGPALQVRPPPPNRDRTMDSNMVLCSS